MADADAIYDGLSSEEALDVWRTRQEAMCHALPGGSSRYDVRPDAARLGLYLPWHRDVLFWNGEKPTVSLVDAAVLLAEAVLHRGQAAGRDDPFEAVNRALHEARAHDLATDEEFLEHVDCTEGGVVDQMLSLEASAWVLGPERTAELARRGLAPAVSLRSFSVPAPKSQLRDVWAGGKLLERVGRPGAGPDTSPRHWVPHVSRDGRMVFQRLRGDCNRTVLLRRPDGGGAFEESGFVGISTERYIDALSPCGGLAAVIVEKRSPDDVPLSIGMRPSYFNDMRLELCRTDGSRTPVADVSLLTDGHEQAVGYNYGVPEPLAVWSPDGAAVAVMTSERRRGGGAVVARVTVFDVALRRVRWSRGGEADGALLSNDGNLHWSPCSTRLVEVRHDGWRRRALPKSPMSRVRVLNAASGATVAVGPPLAEDSRGSDLSPDGRVLSLAGPCCVYYIDARTGREVLPPSRLTQDATIGLSVWTPGGEALLVRPWRSGALLLDPFSARSRREVEAFGEALRAAGLPASVVRHVVLPYVSRVGE